jgi:hypothetical protein
VKNLKENFKNIFRRYKEDIYDSLSSKDTGDPLGTPERQKQFRMGVGMLAY